MNDWFNKERDETHSFRMSNRNYHDIDVSNPALGINIYNNAIPERLCNLSINVLEGELGDNKPYNWSQAVVTESDSPLLNARYCVDFKVGQKNLGELSNDNKNFYNIHEQIFKHVYDCSLDYGSYWGVGLNYFEVFNFVKYQSPGHHFNIHVDHGPAYVSTVSIVAYLNEDYSGGELYFPRFDLNIKPKTGDIIFFPSTFIYEHASKPMISGTKYSVVIMSDYNSRGSLRYYPYREKDNALLY